MRRLCLRTFYFRGMKMDYLKYNDWKNSHATEMQQLEFSRPDDIFIFERFTQKSIGDAESQTVLFAEDIDEAIGYIRHIFLYDILIDSTDDLEYLSISPLEEQQKDVLMLLNYWFNAGKIADAPNIKKELKNFCEEFNKDFSCRSETEYELNVLFGANELRKFLIQKYSENPYFDKKRLSDICDNSFFSGGLLKEFLHTVLSKY